MGLMSPPAQRLVDPGHDPVDITVHVLDRVALEDLDHTLPAQNDSRRFVLLRL